MKSIIHYVDRLFVYFDANEDPSALKRTWCLWEVYCALKTVVKTDVIFPFGFRKKTLRLLEQDFNGTLERLTKVSWDNTEASIRADKVTLTILFLWNSDIKIRTTHGNTAYEIP